jgi:MerR family transcriptional regulator, copper efflux regulator
MKTALLDHDLARDSGLLDIGAAAATTGVSIKMIRHYEEIGLLNEVPRTLANYRVYTPAHIHTLRFIRRSRALGFSMDEIHALLDLWRDRERPSAAVKRIAAAHVATLETKIRELQGMVDTLKHLTHCCAGDDRPDCPILADLAGSETASGPEHAAH